MATVVSDRTHQCDLLPGGPSPRLNAYDELFKNVQIRSIYSVEGAHVTHMSFPVTFVYRGHTVFLKFEWHKPNDEVPSHAKVVQPGDIEGFGQVAAELRGPWTDYPSALAETEAAAQRWINSQWV